MNFILLACVICLVAYAAAEPSCPPTSDPGTVVHFPHPTDCNKFLSCHWGNLVELSCPNGTFWNDSIKACDFQANVICSSTTEPATTTEQPTTTTTELQTTTTTTEVPSTTVASVGKCPDQYDPDHQVYLPHEDCSKFYICTWGGVAIEQKCPANLHWNQQLSYCDYPQQAGCTSTSPATTPSPSTTSSSPSPTTTTTELQTSTSTTEVPSTTFPATTPSSTPSTSTPSPTTTTELPTSTTEVPSTSVTPAGKCPDQYDSNHQVYLPHADCTKYYICSWGGVAIEQKCPANLHWNQQLSYCDYPQQAGCTSTSPATSPSPSTTSSSPSPTTTTTELQTSTSTTEVPSTTVAPAGKCPDQYDPNHQVYLPHADCTKYYICSWGGVAIEQKCPANLHWNQQLSYCDYPQQAGCISTSPATTPSSTTSSSSPSPTTTTTEVHTTTSTTEVPSTTSPATTPSSTQSTSTPSPTTTTELPTSTTEVPSTSVTPAGKCPDQYDPNHQVYLPHADCTKYYICSWGGVAIVQKCPANLHWNQQLSYCDYPQQAGCTSTSPATTPSPSTTSSSPSPTTTTTELQTSTSTTEVPSTTVAPAGKCPDQYDPNHQVYLPHADCTKYYICSWGGVAIEQKCPANLHWSQQLSYCDYPQQAGCTSTSPATTPSPSTTSSSPSPTTTTTELQTSTSTTEVPSTTSPATTPSSTPSTSTPSPTTTTELPTSTTEVPSTSVTPAGKCPDQYDPNHQVYLPHVDCTKYYICSWGGVAIEQKCPANLHWNQQLSYCDYPQQAGCTSTSPATTPSSTTSSSSPSSTTTTTEVHTTTSTTEVPTTTFPATTPSSTQSTSTPSPTTTTELPTSTTEVPSTSVTPAGKCPDQYDSNHQVYLPHADCTKYYICSWGGVAIEQKCPANLHWNQQLSYCDYPQQAGCTSTSPATTPSPSTTSSSPSPTTTTTEFQTSTSTTEVPSTTVAPAGKCPDQYDPNHQVYLPHEDCTKYYICSWGGVAVEQKCPANLHWNQQLSYCDYPQQAGCTSISPSPSPATTPSSTPTSSTSTSASSTASPAPNPATDCPPVYDPNHQVYFPHDDCSKYYICTYEGNKLEQNCPAGLHWSQSHSYCDRPELAQCTSA